LEFGIMTRFIFTAAALAVCLATWNLGLAEDFAGAPFPKFGSGDPDKDQGKGGGQVVQQGGGVILPGGILLPGGGFAPGMQQGGVLQPGGGVLQPGGGVPGVGGSTVGPGGISPLQAWLLSGSRGRTSRGPQTSPLIAQQAAMQQALAQQQAAAQQAAAEKKAAKKAQRMANALKHRAEADAKKEAAAKSKP
jgi:hypothetical protein